MNIKKNDGIMLIANVTIGIFNAETNELIDTIEKHNLFVTLGKTLIADLLAKTSGKTGLSYFAVGTGTAAAALNNTTLETEVFRDTFTKTTVTTGNLNIQYYLASGDGNGNTLTEAGLFGDTATVTANSGTLAARVVHAAVVKTSSIAITYSWDLAIA